MKERSKEKMALLMLEDIFEQLKESGSVKRMLAELVSTHLDDLIETLRADFERVISVHHAERTAAGPVEHTESAPDHLEAMEGVPAPTKAVPEVSVATESPSVSDEPVSIHVPEDPGETLVDEHSDFVLEFSPEFELNLDLPPAVRLPEKESVSELTPELNSIADDAVDEIVPVEAEPASEETLQEDQYSNELLVETESPVERDEESEEEPQAADYEEEIPEESEPSQAEAKVLSEIAPAPEGDEEEQRTTLVLEDEDTVYIHAVALIPTGQPPAPEPFMLEEKGIDSSSFAFALDYSGLRFYLSRINPDAVSVSKTGMLLLGKQETVQLQGVHHSVLNDLRLHGLLLPFEFGSLARGKDDLLGKIDEYCGDLKQALEELHHTHEWTVCARVLDDRIAQFVGRDEPPPRRDRRIDSPSFTNAAHPKKYDFKMLERMLNKEKKLAESVHEALRATAEKATVVTMVGLGSGSSEDWKLILKASYEVEKENLQKFCRTLTDLQYHHIVYDLMLSLAGVREPFSFRHQ